ncbi:unknown similar to AMEV216 [Adoxophyes honmai entomopoxvirus 'L']|uniref:Uncharacterized protein n=1 Tax=Adoxophyes honmai entomopoxvirus 'L' TaxID=1293540 RepID=A0A916P676_9POXV|nr:unknown similar to AMEV216 [Adoxophyes honmai entomopoxvirus 'L']CCU55455.1 unknown similar to AMEV216 [Adoxophyes honmai entomopoxvirus 'L']
MHKSLLILACSIYMIYAQYVCNKDSPEMIVKLPEILDCENVNYIKAKLQLRILNEQTYISDAVLFSNIRSCCTTPPSILVGMLPSKTTNFDILTYDAIIDMNKTLSYQNRNLTYDKNIDSYKFGYPKFDCEHYVFAYNTVCNYYYKMVRTQIHYHKGVMLNNVANTVNCVYGEGICKVSDSDTLVWNVDKTADDIYILQNNYMDAQIIENNNNYHVIFKYMGNTIAVIVDKNEYINNKDGFLNTNIRAYNIRLFFNNRSKRDMNVVQSNMQYINTMIDIEKLQIKQLCTKISLIIMEIYSICKVNAYSCISTFLKKKDISVTVVGNLYMVKMCVNVDIIKYNPAQDLQNNVCHELIPVVFTNNNNNYEGYYNVETEEIFLNQYFTIKGKCPTETRYISCNDNTDDYCIYNNVLGTVEKIKLQIYTLTYDNVDVFNNYIRPSHVNPDYAYRPTLSDMISRPIHVSDMVSHEKNSHDRNSITTGNIIFISVIIISLLYILIVAFILIIKYIIKKIYIKSI